MNMIKPHLETAVFYTTMPCNTKAGSTDIHQPFFVQFLPVACMVLKILYGINIHTAGAKQGGQKKVPLMPPLALKKAAQETASLTKTPVGQQLVTLKMQESPASVAQKATNSSPSKPREYIASIA